MIYPWKEKVVDVNLIKSFINENISKYVIEIQNPVLHSNGLWGSIFLGSIKELSPEIFTRIVVNSIPNISGLKSVYEATKSTDSLDKAAEEIYYKIIEEKVFNDFPFYEISCCNNESVLFPFTSLDMMSEYMKTCMYFNSEKREDSEDSSMRVTFLWYFKKGSKRYTTFYKPSKDLQKKSIYFRYRLWDTEDFKNFAETMGSSNWKSEEGKLYTEASLLESKKFYQGGCIDDIGNIVK